VVATAVGGLVDTVINDVTGVHIPPRDVPALVVALRELFDDADRRHALGDAGCRRAQSRYEWHNVAVDTVRAYATTDRAATLHVRRVG
jgi:glycosyltransferase involved in cell wall biosynthesis